MIAGLDLLELSRARFAFPFHELDGLPVLVEQEDLDPAARPVFTGLEVVVVAEVVPVLHRDRVARTLVLRLIILRLASALVGLPEPRGGWTPAEERAIESVSEDGIDVAAMFAQGGLADYVGVTVVLITAEIPALAVLGGLTEVHWAAFIVVLSLGAVAIAALAYAWRADIYLREHLVPLADRIADTQMTLLLEAA